MKTKRWVQNANAKSSTNKYYQGLKNTFDVVYNKHPTWRCLRLKMALTCWSDMQWWRAGPQTEFCVKVPARYASKRVLACDINKKGILNVFSNKSDKYVEEILSIAFEQVPTVVTTKM
jgi:hypothetical protein